MKNKGISLIVLVITIIVMGILLTAVILDIKDDSVSLKATEAKIKNEVAAINEELTNYISHMEHEYTVRGEIYNKKKLNATINNATYDEKEIEGISNVHDILPSMNSGDYIGAFKIQEGKLVFVGTGEYNFTDEEKTWINEVLEND